MSYLDPTRIHFAGRFQANVSTVNNDPDHFDIETFKPQYQQMQTKTADNGWWNPQGSGDWRLIGCKVTGGWADGEAVPDGDPLLSCTIADSDSEVAAKLVDLDPDQQMVSQIWGLTVRIVGGDGVTLMSGKFEPCAFFDLWARAQGASAGDFAMGAQWHSVLTDVTWAEHVTLPPALEALRGSGVGDILSIKFNVDGYTMSYADPDFTTGRIVGTIGPYYAGEPRHMVAGRQLMTRLSGITPARELNTCSTVLSPDWPFALLDLGNALPTGTPGGPLSNLGPLTLGYVNGERQIVDIAPIFEDDAYAQGDWYERTGGVVQVALPDPQGYADTALAIYNPDKSAFVVENPSCSFLQPEQIVVRMSPGETVELPIRAFRSGEPLAGVDIALLPKNRNIPNDPAGVLAFDSTVKTDENGIATLAVTAHDPGTPRWKGGAESGPDGQVYALTPRFEDPGLAAGTVNPWNFISFHVYSAWAPKNSPPQWEDIQPIMQQYANLYPVMNRFLDLGDEESVKGNLWLLKLAFELPVENPNHMPVTRDLSPQKQSAIIEVLETLGSEKAAGEAVPRPPVKPVVRPAISTEKAAPQDSGAQPLGGKTAALMRVGAIASNEGDDQ